KRALALLLKDCLTEYDNAIRAGSFVGPMLELRNVLALETQVLVLAVVDDLLLDSWLLGAALAVVERRIGFANQLPVLALVERLCTVHQRLVRLASEDEAHAVVIPLIEVAGL